MSRRNKRPSWGQGVSLWGELLYSARLIWRLVLDPRVSTLTKALIPGLMLLYLVFPFDLAPDLIPLGGQIDDLAVFLIASRLFVSFCPPEVVRYHEAALNREMHRAADIDEDNVVDTTYRVVEDEG